MKATFKIVVCDDNENFTKILNNKIADILSRNNIAHNIVELCDGLELLDYCRKNVADIVFLDIDMPNMTGFEAIKKLQEYQPEITIVFVTDHMELAYQAYDYHPYQFISKQDLVKLDFIVPRLIRKIVYSKQNDEVVHIRLDNNIMEIRVTEVMYFKSKRNYVLAFCADGTYYEIHANLKSIYKQVCDKGFIRAQRSYVVNCRFIFDFSASKIILNDNTEITVTRDADMRKEAQKVYGKFKRELRW
ncbi:MAG: LytTR family DNA-binding domain-containing protein [bacterium]|nr:LytTR family DNA-binding domain-containing protein [bacterium]